ncbi:GTP-binding protein, partial [Erythrobacter donghaensis]
IGDPPRFRVVDMPGYGFAKAPKDVVKKWRFLINDYLRGRAALKRTLVLIDSRHGVKPVDLDVMKMLDEAAVSYRLVLTKADKIKASELERIADLTRAEARKHPAAFPDVIITSSEKRMGIDDLRGFVMDSISE